MIFPKLSFGYFLELSVVLFTAMNEVISKYSQISRSLIKFQGKIAISKELQVLLKRQIQISALFKEFKDLHKPCLFCSALYIPNGRSPSMEKVWL